MCGRRFYDLNKLPTPCPYCGVVHAAPKPALPTPNSNGRPSRYPSFKVQLTARSFEVLPPQADVPVADTDGEDPAATAGEEIPELEEEEDDMVAPRIGARGDA